MGIGRPNRRAVAANQSRLITVSGGHGAADSPQFTTVLDAIEVGRPGGGRPRVRPDRVLADKAYSSRANRAWLRRHGIRATIPVPADQAANRRNRGAVGGRPPAFDRTSTVTAMRSSGASTSSNNTVRWLLVTTSSPSATWPPSTSP
ncbi:transposase [Nocardia gamkensis]